MEQLILRQAAIDALRRLYIENPQINNDFVYDMALDQADDAIKQLPPIQPKRGKWEIKKSTIHPYGNDVCCSICGHTMGSTFGYKFCPNCGADMREVTT